MSDEVKEIIVSVAEALVNDLRLAQRRAKVFNEIGEPAPEALMDTLNYPDITFRYAAVLGLGEIGEPALGALTDAAKDEDVNIRRAAVIELGEIGEPALEALTDATKDEDGDVRRAAVQGLGKIGESALEVLTDAAKDENNTVREEAVAGLSKIGKPALAALREVLNDDYTGVRLVAVRGLSEIGEPALGALTEALNDGHVRIREIAGRAIGQTGEPGLAILTEASKNGKGFKRLEAVESLGGIGEPAFEALREALNDDNSAVRRAAIKGLGRLGNHVAPILARLLEDRDPRNREWFINDWVLENSGRTPMDVAVFVKAIFDELIERRSGRPKESFAAKPIVETLYPIIENIAPQLKRSVFERLCDLAFEPPGEDEDIAERATEIGRELGRSDFARMVKARARDEPDKAKKIMEELGGREEADFLAWLDREDPGTVQAKIREFRQPLEELEQASLKRWEGLTRQARLGFYSSLWMSVGWFVVGVAIIGWGLWLLTTSEELAQQIGGAGLSAVVTWLTTISGRFWREPVEYIQKFSAQQARLQASFIGYMNRVAQLRLVFERDYAEGKISLNDMKKYQTLLSEAMEQAAQELQFHRAESVFQIPPETDGNGGKE